MTALALRGYSLLKSGFIATLFAWMTGHLSSIGRAVQVSRQIEANQKIAHLMRHEYPNENYAGILAILNEKTLKEYYKND